jgi:hypothetical protein
MVYIILKNSFIILDYIGYLVSLVIQINIWNGFYTLVHLPLVVTFYFYQNFKLSHSYGQHLKKPPFVRWKYKTLHMVHNHGSKYVESHVK